MVLTTTAEDPDWGPAGISNYIYKKEGENISNDQISNFLYNHNLNNSAERHKAKKEGKKEGRLTKMIEEIKTKIDIQKTQNQTIAQTSKSHAL